ncbi:Nuclear factor NF-kappa-B p110 subunit [Araneus ventricosus]|uniref:Nuclear factor NF-kappa-B p110 subunit n=1 Tax=Araneus ventricosus TaxID=182803 RepID=A0A4Y2E324_ARAVE|nr:Nuclear factor NF-kappa-B p110 subunit [Araneus ventricosus]
MPNYQDLVNEQLTYITLQNVPYAEDTGCFDSVCGMNPIIPGDSVYIETAMKDNGLHLKIIEQPADTFRYRYKSEKGSHGGIKGENTARSKKSYPTVKVENCPPNLKKKVLIKVSLYTNEPEPKPHVYELTGKNAGGTKLDENFMAIFQSLAISTRKKEEVLEILKERKKADKVSKGFSYDEASVEAEAHEEMKSFNLDSAKLCFEAFSTEDASTPLCEKIFSHAINNQKSAATGDLKITRLSRCSGKCSGGDEVFLLCDKVKKEDIKVRFFDEESDWEAYAEFNPAEIHHQVVIIFKTPAYHQGNVYKTVYFELVRPSDSKCSEPRIFDYIPDDDGILHPSNRKILNTQNASLVKNEPSEISRKRKRLNLEEGTELPESYLQNSSLSYSPASTDDEHMPIDQDVLSGIDLDGINLDDSNWTLFPEIFDLLHVENQNFNVDVQSEDLLATNVPSQELGIFPQSYQIYVKADGMNEISNSMDSVSLADQCCKQELEKLKIQKASNDFVTGMKRILLNRDERTYFHYASHLIPLQDEVGNSMLHLGIMEQNENWNFILKMVNMTSEDLINHQNKSKETPLHLAVKGNHVKILLLLLARGGDPNLSDRNGNNCLHLAAKYGHINCLKVLMPPSENRRTWKHKISDIDVLNYDGMSALHIAVMGNFEDCVKFLLNSKADVNLSEKKCGRTSLHLALKHPPLLQAILKQPNVDINAEDFGGYTIVQLACMKTGKPFEVVSSQLKDEKDEIIKFLENLDQDEGGYDLTCCEVESDGESTDSSEFEDAVEDFGSISSNEKVVCKAASTSELKCTNEKKSSLMKIEEELHRYLDKDDNWKILANWIGMDTKHVALLNEGSSPGQTVLRKIKDLYHPCKLQTIIEILQVAGLEDGVQILQKNS